MTHITLAHVSPDRDEKGNLSLNWKGWRTRNIWWTALTIPWDSSGPFPFFLDCGNLTLLGSQCDKPWGTNHYCPNDVIEIPFIFAKAGLDYRWACDQLWPVPCLRNFWKKSLPDKGRKWHKERFFVVVVPSVFLSSMGYCNLLLLCETIKLVYCLGPSMSKFCIFSQHNGISF